MPPSSRPPPRSRSSSTASVAPSSRVQETHEPQGHAIAVQADRRSTPVASARPGSSSRVRARGARRRPLGAAPEDDAQRPQPRGALEREAHGRGSPSRVCAGVGRRDSRDRRSGSSASAGLSGGGSQRDARERSDCRQGCAGSTVSHDSQSLPWVAPGGAYRMARSSTRRCHGPNDTAPIHNAPRMYRSVHASRRTMARLAGFPSTAGRGRSPYRPQERRSTRPAIPAPTSSSSATM